MSEAQQQSGSQSRCPLTGCVRGTSHALASFLLPWREGRGREPCVGTDLSWYHTHPGQTQEGRERLKDPAGVLPAPLPPHTLYTVLQPGERSYFHLQEQEACARCHVWLQVAEPVQVGADLGKGSARLHTEIPGSDLLSLILLEPPPPDTSQPGPSTGAQRCVHTSNTGSLTLCLGRRPASQPAHLPSAPPRAPTPQPRAHGTLAFRKARRAGSCSRG